MEELMRIKFLRRELYCYRGKSPWVKGFSLGYLGKVLSFRLDFDLPKTDEDRLRDFKIEHDLV